MVFGVGLGLLAAFAIFAAFRPPASTPAAKAAPVRSSAARSAPRSRAAKPQQQASNDADRFDFYEVLPHYRVVVPGAKPRHGARPAPAQSDGSATAAPDKGNYVLQVGSFRATGDADRMQASLALLGIESEVQPVAVNDQTWHRVRIGPSSDLTKMNAIRRRLDDAQIESVLMRVP